MNSDRKPAETGLTLDELVVAAVERGLSEEELLRVLVEYRDGEAASEACERVFPSADAPVVWEQLEIQTGEIESKDGRLDKPATSPSRLRDSD